MRLIEQAQRDAKTIVEAERTKAAREAEELLAKARLQAEAEGRSVLQQAEREIEHMEALANKTFAHAVRFVLEQIVAGGK